MQLDIGDAATVDDALRAFTRWERLDGENAWHCAACAARVPALKGVSFAALPPLLFLHLKRFTFDLHTGRRRKLTHRVAFPAAALDLGAYRRPGGGDDADAADAADTDATAEPALYDCAGVLLHSGSADGGHHTALCPAADGTDGWLRMSDEAVSAAPPEALDEAAGSGMPGESGRRGGG